MRPLGIVTNFRMPTHSISQVWGGMQVYGPDQTPALMQALYEYQTAPEEDLSANLVINFIPTNGSMLLTLVYLKPIERPDAFAPFYKLSPAMERTGIMTLHQLMAMFPDATAQPRWTWYVQSFQPDAQLYAQIADLFTAAPEVATIGGLQAGSLISAIQPISSSAVLAGRDRSGGNPLGLRAVNQTWFLVSAAWWNAADDETVDAALRSLHGKIETAAIAADAKVDYIFMNDANAKQEVIASYGPENVRKMKEVANRYDPHRVFQQLVTGGRKLPS